MWVVKNLDTGEYFQATLDVYPFIQWTPDIGAAKEWTDLEEEETFRSQYFPNENAQPVER